MRLIAVALSIASLLDPTRAFAGAWTTPEGKMWMKVAWVFLDSDELFVDSERAGLICGDGTLSLGERGPYDCQLGGGFKASSLLFESSIGLHRRLDLKVQIPVFISAQFLATGTFQQRRGLGDIRFTLQGVLLEAPVVLAANVAVKAPTGFFTQDAVGVPLGEGQWDLAFRILASYPFARGHAWTGIEAGYRIRQPNDDLGIGGLDLGDEILATYELGGRFPKSLWLYLSGRYDLRYQLESKDLSQDVFVPNRPVRAVMYVTPKIIINPFAREDDALNRLGIELEVLLPVWGRGWPADPVWIVALTGSFRLFPEYSGKSRRRGPGQPPPAPAPTRVDEMQDADSGNTESDKTDLSPSVRSHSVGTGRIERRSVGGAFCLAATGGDLCVHRGKLPRDGAAGRPPTRCQGSFRRRIRHRCVPS